MLTPTTTEERRKGSMDGARAVTCARDAARSDGVQTATFTAQPTRATRPPDGWNADTPPQIASRSQNAVRAAARPRQTTRCPNPCEAAERLLRAPKTYADS